MFSAKFRVILSVIVLSIFVMACGLTQMVPPGGSPNSGSSDSSSTAAPADNSSSSSGSSDKSPFPMPPNSQILTNAGGVVAAKVKMSFDDVVSYYRTELTKEGLTEDKTLSVVNKPAFSLQFKGSKNGKTLFIQGADSGDGTVAFSITYQ